MTKDRKNCRPGRTRRKMDCRRCRARPPAVHPVWLGKRGDACARLESQCGGRTTADVVWSHHHSMHDAGAVPPHATNPHVLWSYTATISCFKRRPQQRGGFSLPSRESRHHKQSWWRRRRRVGMIWKRNSDKMCSAGGGHCI